MAESRRLDVTSGVPRPAAAQSRADKRATRGTAQTIQKAPGSETDSTFEASVSVLRCLQGKLFPFILIGTPLVTAEMET